VTNRHTTEIGTDKVTRDEHGDVTSMSGQIQDAPKSRPYAVQYGARKPKHAKR